MAIEYHHTLYLIGQHDTLDALSQTWQHTGEELAWLPTLWHDPGTAAHGTIAAAHTLAHHEHAIRAHLRRPNPFPLTTAEITQWAQGTLPTPPPARTLDSPPKPNTRFVSVLRCLETFMGTQPPRASPLFDSTHAFDAACTELAHDEVRPPTAELHALEDGTSVLRIRSEWRRYRPPAMHALTAFIAPTSLPGCRILECFGDDYSWSEHYAQRGRSGRMQHIPTNPHYDRWNVGEHGLPINHHYPNRMALCKAGCSTAFQDWLHGKTHTQSRADYKRAIAAQQDTPPAHNACQSTSDDTTLPF